MAGGKDEPDCVQLLQGTYRYNRVPELVCDTGTGILDGAALGFFQPRDGEDGERSRRGDGDLAGEPQEFADGDIGRIAAGIEDTLAGICRSSRGSTHLRCMFC